MSRFVRGPAAVVLGGPAWLLLRILASPDVAKLLSRPPPWLDRADVAATVAAIHQAAFKTAATALERETATLVGAVTPESPWTVERAAAVLQLSRRRTQELAAGGSLGGQRVGRQWVLDEVAVREFARQRRKGAA